MTDDFAGDLPARRGARFCQALLQGDELLLHSQKGLDHARVEVVAGALQDDRAGHVVRHGRFVDPPRRQRVVDVGQGDDPCGPGDLVPLQTAGIAAAVQRSW